MSDTSSETTFTTFGAYGPSATPQRSWISSLMASSAIYIGVILLIVALSATKTIIEKTRPVELKFVEKVVKEPPPPPPAPVAEPKPEIKPQAPAAAAPIVRPDQKIRRLDKPPVPKKMVAPTEMPQAAPKEADPSQDKGIAVYGEGGKGDPAGLEGGVAKGGVAGGEVGGAIALPEDAAPPMPVEGNDKPTYPQEARATGQQGTVVLKVTILADGSVAKVEVLRGEEPFKSAAVAAVKTWKYTPAMFKGQPISVYRIIQIPFKLTA
ncbi:MAG TPA: TonB family protein [Candidatus Binatia bacterium]|jgi:protein TonB|nr:TonB family protein [Candidatus Binatia bacterium]